jgi:hypothetical protein
MPDNDGLTAEKETRAIELIRENWGADLGDEMCAVCEAPALTLMGGESVCSTECALSLSEAWIQEATNRAELSNAVHIYSDLDDLIERAAALV